MASAIIYTFSGTGNTFTAAEMIKKDLEREGVKTNIYRVHRPFGDVPPPGNYDFIGFGYPVHAFNCPQIFYRFVKSLPSAPGKKAFLFKTSGEPFRLNDASSYKLIKELRKKGLDPVLEQHLLMPYNIVFRYKDSLVKQMYQYTGALCALLVKRLLAGERGIPRYRLLHKAVSLIFRIQWPGARLNGRLYSVGRKKCSKCMLCVKSCPSGNIGFENGRFRFDFSCAMCMRCAMYCPENAVNIGLLRFWKVNGTYDFCGIAGNPEIPSDFIGAGTRGYFRLFRNYYRNADSVLAEYGIDIPGA
jgi:ferredoxin/flavodoxin